MRVIEKINEFRDYRAELSKNETLGLVPTMGNLHKGHLSLVEKSLQECDQTVVSLFVNPTQFGPGEDFDRYPRTLESDLKLLKPLQGPGKLVVFTPSTAEFYPSGYSSYVECETPLNSILCAASRPGHFKGVTSVVAMLFNLIAPSKAYFGQKDFQQFTLIKKMVRDLFFDVEIIGMPIVRDHDGLALSSRNQYLTPSQREEALELYKSLKYIAEYFQKLPVSKALPWLDEYKETQEVSRFEYLDVYNACDLTPLTIDSNQGIVLGAYKLGKTRLIDNLCFDLNKGHL